MLDSWLMAFSSRPAQITQRLLTPEPNSISGYAAKIRPFVLERLGNIRQLLNADVQRAKFELAKHVSRIRMVPEGPAKNGHYVAVGEWNLLGGLAEGLGWNPEATEKRVRNIAGGGFEPATFGL
jgi:hypothetical protein